MSRNTLNTLKDFNISDSKKGKLYSLPALEKSLGINVSRLPVSIRIVLESVLRNCDGKKVTEEHVKQLASWGPTAERTDEIPFVVARVVLQDFTGVPLLADLAAMRNVAAKMGIDAKKIEPLVPVDLVVDHSVTIDHYREKKALDLNMKLEFSRNNERYQFMKWGMQAFDTFGVVPPGFGIVHQVNLEYLARGVHHAGKKAGDVYYPDTLVGTDSHTTMINGLGILGWGVGGIEAEAAMLGQPVSMLIPEVIGFKLSGKLKEGITATDLVLTVTQMLRSKGVVGKFVEFYGDGLADLPLADRATIANMAPEYGATCGFFPVDQRTIDYLTLTGRDSERIELVRAYCQAQGLWRDSSTLEPMFTDTLELDMSAVEPSLAGPKRPQDRVRLSEVDELFNAELSGTYKKEGGERVAIAGDGIDIGHGDVMIAAITSCTNTSNPSVLVAAGLVARKARALGLDRQPWVKTSLAPGSQVVTDYLDAAGLSEDLNAIGFNLVGYGCTTCIGNSGPLDPKFSAAIAEHDLVVASVLSGNRNFEGRVSPDCRANYLASPPLVVAYAMFGTVTRDITKCPIGQDRDGKDVMLADIWPSNDEVRELIDAHVHSDMFRARYADVYHGDEKWRDIAVTGGDTYAWPASSTYIRNPPYFKGMTMTPEPLTDIKGARVLALFGDSITTDHISPAGAIKRDSPAGDYLSEHQVPRAEFNSYGARRGNHQVMMRGTFANIRIRNRMLDGIEGGMTRGPDGEVQPIYDAAMAYQAAGTPLVVLAGKEYGTGSSRDWAAKGTILLGVRAVLVESYERIHRSNLVGMGVLPLRYQEGESAATYSLDGSETFDISGIAEIEPRQDVTLQVTRKNGESFSITARCRIDTYTELEYYRSGGILHYVLRNLAA